MLVADRQPRKRDRWSPTKSSRRFQGYYIQRDVQTDSVQDYWKTKIDPDGVTRQMDSLEERERYLGDIAEELAFVQSLKPGNILDVGCGLGWFLGALSPEWNRHGVEPCNYAVSRAKEDCPEAKISEGKFPSVHYPIDYFDAVFCHHVIEHMTDPIDAIVEMRKALKPNGWLIVATPDFGSPCALRFGDNYRMLHDPTHISLFTNESMHRLLKDHGFRIERISYPFPERYATAETMHRWNDPTQISPPWPGNWLTFYARKGNYAS